MRFREKVAVPDGDGCWIWQASIGRDGYGRFYPGGGAPSGVMVKAHRFSYELHVGPIPHDLDMDHLCRNRACVNPSHLEPVTRRENLLRGDTFPARNIAKTHCPKGHPYDQGNTYVTKQGHRHCRTCHRDRERARWHAGARR